MCRAVGTFARALDCSSSVRQPSLHMSAAAASRDITLVPIPSAPSVSLHISTGDVKKPGQFSPSVYLALLSSMPWTPCTGTAMTSPVLWACSFLKEGQCYAGMRWRSGAHQRQTCLRRRWRSTAKTSMISGKTLWVCTESRGGGIIDLIHSDSFSNDSNTIRDARYYRTDIGIGR